MGKVTTDIILKNAADVSNAGRGLIKEPEVRTMAVNAVIDTGAGTLIINEAARRQLGLAIQGTRNVLLAGGTRQVFQQTEPVSIYWKNRRTACPAIVLPNTKEILLGAIPLEDTLGEVSGAHGDDVVCLAL
jgi:clan AA aspartic protease